MTTPVLLDITDGIAKITLNRPDKGNALDQPMADALLTTMGQSYMFADFEMRVRVRYIASLEI